MFTLTCTRNTLHLPVMGWWGYNFFESECDLDLIGDYYEPAGLEALESKAKERMKQKQAQSNEASASTTDNPATTDEDDDFPILSIHAAQCADVELVREHLDGGVLRKLVEEANAKTQRNPDEDDKLAAFHQSYYSYHFMLLGACAMTLGCKLEDDFKELLISKYRTAGLKRDAVRSMQLALSDGPGRYRGTAYDFLSKRLVETTDSEDEEEAASGIPRVVRMREYPSDVCGGCGGKDRLDSEPLLACGRCKTKKYCGRVCQQAHFQEHKRVCKPQ